MAVNTYECMLILDANRYARDSAAVSGQIDEFVKKHGGEMLVSRLWEERRLAYPIAGQRKAAYWLSYFKLDSDKVTALERDLRLSDSILRFLTLRVDQRIAEALVAHAAGAKKSAPATAPRETSASTTETSTDDSDKGGTTEAAEEPAGAEAG